MHSTPCAHHALRTSSSAAADVFQSRPRFGEIRERNLRALAPAVIADHQRGLVIQSVGPLHRFVPEQVALVVVLVDRRQRLADVRCVQQVAQPGDVGQILPQQLIDAGSRRPPGNPDVSVLAAPIPIISPLAILSFGNAADLLDVVLAVEQVLVDPLAAAVEQPPVFVRATRRRRPRAPSLRRRAARPGTRCRTADSGRRTRRRRCCAARLPSRRRDRRPSRPGSRRIRARVSRRGQCSRSHSVSPESRQSR